MIPGNMTAIEVESGSGPASALKPVVIATPEPGPGEILIRNHAAGVNRPDIFQRQGLYPPSPGASPILGLEVAGEIAAIGPGVERWQVGQRVTALIGGGGYAEFAVADARHALRIPSGLSFTEAAALPETAFTVYANMMELGRLAKGETIMIHGATSGIGVMAIQMAKAVGARVIATGRGPQKVAQAEALGADIALDTSGGEFAEAVAGHGGVDLILDMVAGPYFQQNLMALNHGGRLVHIAFQAGANVELPVPFLMQKQLTVTGSTLRGRDATEKGRLAAALEQHVWPLIEARAIECFIDQVFPLADAAAAHAHLESGHHLGKVMLSM